MQEPKELFGTCPLITIKFTTLESGIFMKIMTVRDKIMML